MRAYAALLLLCVPCLRCSFTPPGGGGDDGGGPGDGGGGGGADGALADGAIEDGGNVSCISDLVALTLSAASSSLRLTGASPAPLTIDASGTFAGGAVQAIAGDRLAWVASRSDDTPPGSIVNGVFTPNPAAGGTVTITASDGCVSASITIQIFLDVVIAPPTDPAPWTGPPVTSGTVPEIVYPSDQTRFPRNIYRTLFQWRTGGASEFRLSFEGPNAKIVVYSDGVHASCAAAQPAAGCWEADEQAWSYIAGSNAGSLVTWTVDALDRSGATPTVRRGAPIQIGFSTRDVTGAIFYWSTTSAGIRRANIRDAVLEDYLTGKPRTTLPDGDQVGCVACHVVSRDGRYMVAPVNAQSSDGLWVLEVTTTAPPTPLVKSIADTGGHGFATISPDDSKVVAAWGGRMWMLDRASGDKLADLALGGTLQATHPDWSPDNSQLVFATGKGDAPGRAGLALLPYDANTNAFGTPSVLVPASGDRSNLFPMFSPDGRWIAYSEGKGGHGDNQAQLRLVRAALPAEASMELVRANRVVSNRVTDGQHQNSQPTWAPPGDLAWIAFNSKREYGVVLAEGTQQIWVAAVDLSAVGAGADPSFPAFRIPFQGLEENNHRAFWTLDVRDPPPVPDGGVPDAAGGDSGVPDPGDPLDGGACYPLGMGCDPLNSACCVGLYCDSLDDGVTYQCTPGV